MQIFKLVVVKHALYLLLLFSLVGAACQNTSNPNEASSDVDVDSLSPREALYSEVMQIHDDVMPKMHDIMSLSKKLKAVKATNESDILEIKNKITDLENAGESMMVWMRNFNPDGGNTPEEALEYLEGEKEKIKTVKREMEGAIANADSFLQARQDSPGSK